MANPLITGKTEDLAAGCPMSVGRMRQALVHWFESAGIDQPAYDARYLLASCLGLDQARIAALSDRLLSVPEQAKIMACAERRVRREPMAYITGTTGFYRLDFCTGPGVLVPRPDSEILVETAARLLQDTFAQDALYRSAAADETDTAIGPLTAPPESRPAGSMHVLDTCTGSACIGISLARLLLDRSVPVSLDLADLDDRALAWAMTNARLHLPPDSFRLFQADLFPPGPDLSYHLITANPPYIPAGDLDGLMPEVSVYEPRIALDGGPDGLDVLARLIREAWPKLKPGGWLVLEHGYDQAGLTAQLLESSGYCNIHKGLRDWGG